MDLVAALSAINTSITLVGRLREISKNMEQAELKAIIADLANELADAKLKMASLKDESVALREERAFLDAKAAGEKPKVQWGCYIFEGDGRLYCPACYDTSGKKHLTTRVDSHKPRCCVCQTELFC
jgi:hypothetical protein